MITMSMLKKSFRATLNCWKLVLISMEVMWKHTDLVLIWCFYVSLSTAVTFMLYEEIVFTTSEAMGENILQDVFRETMNIENSLLG